MSQRPGTPFDNPMGSMMDIIHLKIQPDKLFPPR